MFGLLCICLRNLSFRPSGCSRKIVFLINWQGFLRKNGDSAGPLKRKTLAPKPWVVGTLLLLKPFLAFDPSFFTHNERLLATVLLSNTFFFQYLSNFDPPIWSVLIVTEHRISVTFEEVWCGQKIILVFEQCWKWSRHMHRRPNIRECSV